MDRAIVKRVSVNASPEQVWRAWSTKEGLQSFFAPRCAIELWPGGTFEIWFFPDNPPGTRGYDYGCRLCRTLP